MKSASLVVVCLILILFGHTALAQNDEKKVIVSTGDINRPYEIINWLFHAEPIEVEVFSFGGYPKAYNEAVTSYFGRILPALRKMGADALINTKIQVVLYPTAKGQNPGDVVITGTIVKFKTEPPK